ncbi:DeoR family transcriptional regulator, partial [[Mycoplasma] collis]|uniref:DeoR family transcriptional regulator n=1 Tax=[Mycoplasma] collis TaxID=2127 RepID=UPI00051BE184
ENITLKLKNFTLNNKNDTLKNNELNKNKETSKENLSSSFSKTKERLDLILKLLKDNEKLTIQELADILKISRITIIRDLNYLQKNKKIERISGKKTGFWKII